MRIAERLCAIALAVGSGAVPHATLAASVGDPWAIGYGVQVVRSCPNWAIEPQETLARRGVLVRPARGAGLMPFGDPFERDYYRGQADADADLRRHRDFCRRVRAIAGRRWPRLARVLVIPHRRAAG